MKHAGILYHPKHQKAVDFSRELEQFLLAQGIKTWLCSAWEPERAKQQLNGTDILLSVGGDGTILRAVRTVLPDSVPILGINLGRLGFMTELKASDALKKLPRLLNNKGWVEERAILEARVLSSNKIFYALNDVFVGRRSSARLVTINCRVNNANLTIYRSDGIIVASASGSTGYSLAAGGPILHPEAREMVLQPVCSHFTFDKALVLPANARMEFEINTTHEAMISIDGQTEFQLQNAEKVEVRLSSHTAKFLRLQTRSYFYKSLEARLKRKIT